MHQEETSVLHLDKSKGERILEQRTDKVSVKNKRNRKKISMNIIENEVRNAIYVSLSGLPSSF